MKIYDDAIPLTIAKQAYVKFPNASWNQYHFYNDGNASKYGQQEGADWGDDKILWAEVASRIDARIANLARQCFADYTFYGSGLHYMPQGSFLRRHLDASCHAKTGWKREYSATLFLNPHYAHGDGGVFTLHDDLTDTTQEVEPIFNRLILFRCNEFSSHSVSKVFSDYPRLSFSMFFFSEDEPVHPIRHKAKFYD